MAKVTKEQYAYNELTRVNAFWGRIDSNTIYIYTDGYLTQDCHNIESFMLANGFRSIEQNFDKYCGKTKTIYKHK